MSEVLAEGNTTGSEKKVVADYFGKTPYDMHIVDMFMRVLVDNDIEHFAFDASSLADVKIAIRERGAATEDDTVETPKEETTNVDEGLESPTPAEGSAE